MSLLYLYRFKFAVKLQIILFENAIIGHFATRAVLALLLGNHLVSVFSCEFKVLNIKKIEIEGLGLGWVLARFWNVSVMQPSFATNNPLVASCSSNWCKQAVPPFINAFCSVLKEQA